MVTINMKVEYIHRITDVNGNIVKEQTIGKADTPMDIEAMLDEADKLHAVCNYAVYVKVTTTKTKQIRIK